MGGTLVLKKPKLEKDDYDFAYWPRPSSNGSTPKPLGSFGSEEQEKGEEEITEEAMLALIAHRERDVERCKLKLLHHQSLLDTAEKKLAEAQSRLARYRVRRPDRKPPPLSQRDPSYRRQTRRLLCSRCSRRRGRSLLYRGPTPGRPCAPEAELKRETAAWMEGREEGEGAGGREGETRRDAASVETAAVRRRVSMEPSMEVRGTPEAELKRETAAWMEGRCGVSSKNGERAV